MNQQIHGQQKAVHQHEGQTSPGQTDHGLGKPSRPADTDHPRPEAARLTGKKNEAVLGPFTVRDVTVFASTLILFVASLIPMIAVRYNLWNLGSLFFLGLGILLPLIVAALFVARRLTPESKVRIGSLSVDQFASVVASFALAFFFLAAASDFVPSLLVALIGSLGLFAATVLAPFLPFFAGDFLDRAEVPAHIVARESAVPFRKPSEPKVPKEAKEAKEPKGSAEGLLSGLRKRLTTAGPAAAGDPAVVGGAVSHGGAAGPAAASGPAAAAAPAAGAGASAAGAAAAGAAPGTAGAPGVAGHSPNAASAAVHDQSAASVPAANPAVSPAASSAASPAASTDTPAAAVVPSAAEQTQAAAVASPAAEQTQAAAVASPAAEQTQAAAVASPAAEQTQAAEVPAPSKAEQPSATAPAVEASPAAASPAASASVATMVHSLVKSQEPIGATVDPATRPEEHEDEPVHEAFWFAVAQPRTAVDERTGAPAFVIEPGGWVLALEDRGHEFLVQHTDGRVGLLRDLSNIERG